MKTAQQVIIEMFHEVEELKKKYGTRSKIAAIQSERVKILADYWDRSEAHKKHFVGQYATSQVLRAKKEKKSYEDTARLMGWDSEKWKFLDKLDDKIEAIKKQMK